MTTDFTPTVPPFEVSTPFGVCTVKDTRVPYDNEEYARVTFEKNNLKVNGKTYESDVDYTLKPLHPLKRDTAKPYTATGRGMYSEVTDNANAKIIEYLEGPEVRGALTRLGMLAPVDPAEIRVYKRERVYAALTHAIDVVRDDMGVPYHAPAEERVAARAFRDELVDEALTRIVSRRLDGVSYQNIRQGEYGNE